MKTKEIANMKSDRQYIDSMKMFCFAAIGLYLTLLVLTIINYIK